MAVPIAQSSLDYSDEQIARLFEQAKEDFEHETHQKVNVLRRFDTVDEFIEQIRKEKSAFGSFREHEHPNFFRHMRNALKPVQILANLFSGPASNVSDATLFKYPEPPAAVFHSQGVRPLEPNSHLVIILRSQVNFS
jgi:hypothetical protein